MLVHFTTDDTLTSKGFRATIKYMHIKPNCVNWLNIAGQLLKSPDYPTIDCSWVITAPSTESTIIIQFETFEVNTYDCRLFKQKHFKFLANVAIGLTQVKGEVYLPYLFRF